MAYSSCLIYDNEEMRKVYIHEFEHAFRVEHHLLPPHLARVAIRLVSFVMNGVTM